MKQLFPILCIIIAAPFLSAANLPVGTTDFQFAIYFAPTPTEDPIEALDSLRTSKYEKLETIGLLSHEWVEIENYQPPSAEYFRYMTIGLDQNLAPRLAEATQVLVLTFQSPPKDCLEMNRLANELTADLAETTGGYPWDEECRLLYSQQAWRSKRVDTWHEGIPDISQHMNMHAYRNPELIRIITLGMRKFNQPDLVLIDVSSNVSQAAGNTLNYLAQAMLEGQTHKNMKMNLVLNSIKHPAVLKSALENPEDGATGEIEITLKEAEWEDGDPNNLILNLTFPDENADTETERQGLALSRLYGAKDEISGIEGDDPELLAASAKAKKAFFALKDHFDKGLDANERLLIKHGFKVSGEKEFMWVEVLQWNSKKIKGILLNDSYYDSKLVSGKRVTIPTSQVFDYIHYKPDGTSDGNETGKVIMSRQ